MQLNLSTTATMGTAESGHYKEVAIVERLETLRSDNGDVHENVAEK